MKTFSLRFATMAIGVLPVLAIEPPVDSAPIPPQEPVKPAPAPADGLAKPQEIVPMPEVAGDRPYIGVILEPLPDMLSKHLRLKEDEGIMILELVPEGPAANAGLEINDVLVEVEGERVNTRDEVRALVEQYKVGDEVELGIIHEGQRKKVSLKLGAAPQAMAGFQAPAPGIGGGLPLEGFLEGLPEKHADAIRDALEQNLKQFEGLEEGNDGAGELQREMMKRMQQKMGDMQLNMGEMELKMGNIDAVSSIRLLDDEGSIEMKQSKGSKEAKVYDKQGNLLWEGPYDTEQDKAAVPEDIGQRLERLNFDIQGDANGMQLRINPNRFRPLDEIEPDVEEAPEEE